MAKIKKKGTSGNAKNYITRSQAVRKLQISLPDFRRLCIFKGIYPREPRSKKRASKSSTPSTTFYYTKDIQYLLHEPLLAKFRDQKALAKKISKALGRNEVSDASRLERNLTPKMKLDHIIKERYPTFVDALRDLDDALSMLFLFANLPSTTEVPPGMIAKCQRLTMEFEHYLIRTHSLRKSFLSIKGIYYQATIQAQDILYLVPYRFVQRTAGDVDYRIMATFVEFYTTLLGFVNYRLYTGIGLVYPPRFNLRSEEQGAELAAFQLEHKDDGVEETEQQQLPEAAANESAQAEVDKLLALSPEDEPVTSQTVQADEEQDAENGTTTALDQFESVDPSADSLLQPSRTADVETAAKLFEPFTFYLSRETPRHPLEFILKAFGCRRVGWPSLDGEAGSYCNEDDPRITHQIVDRPDLPLPSPPPEDDDEPMLDDGVDDSAAIRKANERVPGRTYVQPQWVWDCINAGQLLRPDLYAPGATLPPHLSPWVKAKPGEYDPTKPLTEQQTEAEAAAADDSSDEDEDEDEEADDDGDIDEGSDGEEADGVGDDGEAEVTGATLQGQDVAPGEGMDVDVGGSDHESESDAVNGADDDDFGGFDDDEEEDDAAREAREHQAELEAEALGKAVEQKDPKEKKKAAKAQAQSKRTHAERQAEEAKERAKMMMSNRKRKMYEKMVYSNAEKEAQSAQLRSKRQKYEKEQGKKQKAKQ